MASANITTAVRLTVLLKFIGAPMKAFKQRKGGGSLRRFLKPMSPSVKRKRDHCNHRPALQLRTGIGNGLRLRYINAVAAALADQQASNAHDVADESLQR